MFSRQELAADFRTLGVAPGDIVMLHASVRAVGDVAGGPDQIHLALRDAVGQHGTVVMYVGCPDYYDDVGRGLFSADQEQEILGKLPAFNPLTTRAARSHGVLAEFFRTYPGTVVNNHVARFAAAGRHADFVVSAHPWNYPFGIDTPLDRCLTLDGRIVLLGSDHDAVTFLHYVEHVIDIPNRKVARFRVPMEEHGERVWRNSEEFNTADEGAHENWPDRFFAKIVDTHLRETGNQGGRVGNAVTYLLSAREVFNFAAPTMIAVAADARAADRLRADP
jgi:aminoglycoside 3-N-acetyltransferase